jgi:hypothetical protein
MPDEQPIAEICEELEQLQQSISPSNDLSAYFFACLRERLPRLIAEYREADATASWREYSSSTVGQLEYATQELAALRKIEAAAQDCQCFCPAECLCGVKRLNTALEARK